MNNLLLFSEMTGLLGILYDSKFRFFEDSEAVTDGIGILHISTSLCSGDKIICSQLQALSSHISHAAEVLLSFSQILHTKGSCVDDYLTAAKDSLSEERQKQ